MTFTKLPNLAVSLLVGQLGGLLLQLDLQHIMMPYFQHTYDCNVWLFTLLCWCLHNHAI